MLASLLKGHPNKLIARELNLSVETVKDHVAAVLRALGVSSHRLSLPSAKPAKATKRLLGLAPSATLDQRCALRLYQLANGLLGLIVFSPQSGHELRGRHHLLDRANA